MTSFKAKLVVYFLLLSLLPIAAVFWAFSSVATRSETGRVEARLEQGVRAGLAGLQQELDARAAIAQRLARNPVFQRALEHQDAKTLRRLVNESAGIEVLTITNRSYGSVPPLLSAKREADVLTKQGLVGSVTAFLPFDARVAARLHKSAGLGVGDTIAILEGTRIVAADPRVHGVVDSLPGVPTSLSVGGVRYHVLASGNALDETQPLRLAVLSPQHAIDRATGATRDRLLIFLALVLLAVGLIAYAHGRTIARTLAELVEAANGIARGRFRERVPIRGRDEFATLGHAFNDMADELEARLAELDAERARLRDAFARFGDALSATHDPEQLLPVVLEAAREATGATGAALIDERGQLYQVGDSEADGERLQLPLVAGQASFGTLVLVGPSFGEEERLTANSLAGHAVVALENARLHSIVERQALVDGLTGLANRRHCEESLASEIARSKRFGTPLTAVFADLDDFKQVNDDYGHAAGDVVLREFANILRESVRGSDLAGRWGGEEFLLLLSGADAAGGLQLAERVRATLEKRVILAPEGVQVQLTCSLGVASYPASPDAKTLLACADEGLYRAKRGGKNRVETASPVSREHVRP